MQGVPATISGKAPAYIRGEVVLTKSEFNKARAEGVQANTPRNAGVGFAKDSLGSNAHRLRVYCYDIDGDEFPRLFESEKFELLEKLGFTCAPWAVVEGFWGNDSTDQGYALFWHRFADMNHRTRDLDLPADGVVVKCNTGRIQDELGFSSNGLNPEFAIAHKFAAPVCTCEVLGILWEPGPTGVITPVLQVDALLDGINLRNVSGHNLRRLMDLKVQIGSKIVVERAGMVIPYLVGLAHD
jgi:DNA ligase (NAD+)